MAECPFDEYAGPSVVEQEWLHAYVIEPLNPVVPGHRLVVARKHFERAEDDPREYGFVMTAVALFTRGLDCNIIQSNGAAASQTVPHVHVHIVPRVSGDGLQLPWGRQ